MNENIDLTRILKYCPKGYKLYTPLYGEVEFKEITYGSFPIVVDGACFTEKGLYYDNTPNAECLLFPSKEQRDWSKFTAPWYKKEMFNPKTLKPFDKVMVRDYHNEAWLCTLFSHQGEDCGYPYDTASGAYFCCIPYNDDTKHLVGTKEEAPEYYRYWED